MPITKSAKKEVRKDKKRRIRNKTNISSMKSVIKKVKKAKNQEEAKPILHDAIKKIDKTASRGIIHKNKASRLKSRLSVFVNKLPKQAAQA